MSDTDAIIGGKIKNLREGIKLSQSKMAEMFSWNSSISPIFNGELTTIYTERVVK